ncbi:MAG: pyridoxal-phosphate dependent enzyme [Planctomycetes bacterium]|nr:pyridoxal-phosphate dependent enzyme [Planctomycetota bacterium]
MSPTNFLERVRVRDAVPRLAGVVARTPLTAFESEDERVEMRLKLENLQETGAFKARGAWNQIAQLSPSERAAGVVTTSSGNHGKALAWAAARAGVHATIVMPGDAYPNKIQACRDFGAEVVLAPSRNACDELCAERVRAGATLVHPYDAERTAQGAGTVGLEIAEDWPEVDVVVTPVGGGGLVSGVALAIRQALGGRPAIVGVEPEGSATLAAGVARGEPVQLPNTSKVQGLCPPYSGAFNIAVAKETGLELLALSDAEILAAQAILVRVGGWVVEPAGAAAFAAVREQRLPARLYVGRDARKKLRVACVVSGGNPDPAQLAAVQRGT